MSGLTADDVRNVSFSKPPLGEAGYDESRSTDFRKPAVRRLEGRGQLSADDVRGVRLRTPPILQRGYDQDEVDALLTTLLRLSPPSTAADKRTLGTVPPWRSSASGRSATALGGARACPAPSDDLTAPGRGVFPPPLRCPPENRRREDRGLGGLTKTRRTARTGYLLRSASERSCRSANVRPRPASGITIPAHNPSAFGSSQASRAHNHRRGQQRQMALASLSAVVVHARDPARPMGVSYTAASSLLLQKTMAAAPQCARIHSMNRSDAAVSATRRTAVHRSSWQPATPRRWRLRTRCVDGFG